MSIEINPVRPIQDTGSVGTSADVKQAASSSSAVGAEQAYTVDRSGGKPNRFQVDYDKIRALKADYRRNYSAFEQMVSALLQKQGDQSKDVMQRIFGAKGNFDGVKDLGKTMASLQVDDATAAQAASLIDEDGALGVKQVSQNILDFAKAVSGGDPANIKKLKDAFLKGFADAERVWGGTLPDISYRTKQAVLDGFDEWEKSFA